MNDQEITNLLSMPLLDHDLLHALQRLEKAMDHTRRFTPPEVQPQLSEVQPQLLQELVADAEEIGQWEPPEWWPVLPEPVPEPIIVEAKP